MKAFFKNYWKCVREGSTGLAIAPFSSALWHSFIDSLVDVVMTLITFAFLLACWCIYPIAVLFFALGACEGERRSAIKRAEFLKRMNRGDCIDWRDEADPPKFFGIDPASGPDQTSHVIYLNPDRIERCDKVWPKGRHGWGRYDWYCSREKGHSGPCAARRVDE